MDLYSKPVKNSMIYPMDDRKKQIGELEQRKREQIVFLDSQLTRLGETLLNRMGDSFQESDFGEIAVFRRLKHDIANSETAIQTVEEQIRRFRELEETIEVKEQEDSVCLKELGLVYGKLGKTLLDAYTQSGEYADFCASYREQAEALRTKVLSLEERIAGLESKEGGNVFTWVGKNAQGLVLGSFLTKAQDNLEQLRRNVGEHYSRRESTRLLGNETDAVRVEGVEVEHLCADIERRRAESHDLLQDLTELKEERRLISGSMNAEGGPLKQIKSLKNHIGHVRDELKTLYRRIGTEAATAENTERRSVLNSLITDEDHETLDNAARSRQLISDNETAIKQLEASLAIDEEKDKIEKFRRMINDKKEKIAQAEKNIMEYEEDIRVCETTIQKLQGG